MDCEPDVPPPSYEAANAQEQTPCLPLTASAPASDLAPPRYSLQNNVLDNARIDVEATTNNSSATSINTSGPLQTQSNPPAANKNSSIKYWLALAFIMSLMLAFVVSRKRDHKSWGNSSYDRPYVPDSSTSPAAKHVCPCQNGASESGVFNCRNRQEDDGLGDDCVSCDTGYHLKEEYNWKNMHSQNSGSSYRKICVKNECYCWHGEPMVADPVGPTGACVPGSFSKHDQVHNCTSCLDGYFLAKEDRLTTLIYFSLDSDLFVCEERRNCTCDNGTPQKDRGCPKSFAAYDGNKSEVGDHCESCDEGYEMKIDRTYEHELFTKSNRSFCEKIHEL